MIFHFGPKSTVLLVFFAHGIVFTLLLLMRAVKDDSRSSGWLSFFIFLCSLYITPFMFGYAGWYARDGYREVLFYLPLQQVLLIGPVVYFYTRSLLDPGFVFAKKHIVHFIPALLYLLYTLVVFAVDILMLEEVYFYADGRDKDLAPWYQVAGLVSMFFYFALSLRHYERYKKLAFEMLSFAETVVYRWMQRYLLAVLIILLLRVLFFILHPEWGEFGSKFWYYLCFSLLFYYISIMGYTQAVRMDSPFWSIAAATEPIASLKAVGHPERLEDEGTPTQDIPDLDGWKARLEGLMEEQRLYANPGLTLPEVAELLETTSRQVSQVVNQGFQMNFNDFVNRYRTLAVIEKLKAGEQRSKTLLALALECGFNSKSTFNRAFKKLTGMTPKAYLDRFS